MLEVDQSIIQSFCKLKVSQGCDASIKLGSQFVKTFILVFTDKKGVGG